MKAIRVKLRQREDEAAGAVHRGGGVPVGGLVGELAVEDAPATVRVHDSAIECAVDGECAALIKGGDSSRQRDRSGVQTRNCKKRDAAGKKDSRGVHGVVGCDDKK